MLQGPKYRHVNIYLNCNILLSAKKKCFPIEISILITNISAEINLQEMVDHTAKRIVESQKTFVQMGMIYNAGHSYKQQFSDLSVISKRDSISLFSICLVPLPITAENNSILWSFADQ